jgi:hypothetical protein
MESLDEGPLVTSIITSDELGMYDGLSGATNVSKKLGEEGSTSSFEFAEEVF